MRHSRIANLHDFSIKPFQLPRGMRLALGQASKLSLHQNGKITDKGQAVMSILRA